MLVANPFVYFSQHIFYVLPAIQSHMVFLCSPEPRQVKNRRNRRGSNNKTQTNLNLRETVFLHVLAKPLCMHGVWAILGVHFLNSNIFFCSRSIFWEYLLFWGLHRLGAILICQIDQKSNFDSIWCAYRPGIINFMLDESSFFMSILSNIFPPPLSPPTLLPPHRKKRS